MKRALRILKITGANFVILLSGLVIVELIFGGWFQKKNKIRFLNLVQDKEVVYYSDLYSDSLIEITYKRDKFGFRGQHIFNKPNTIDILTLGGSTTDQRFITEGQTWQDNLEELFLKLNKKVRIANAGVDGQSTVGHIKDFEIWFPSVPGLKPRILLFYIGINDVARIVGEVTYDDLNDNNLVMRIKENSVFYNLFRTIKGINSAQKENLRNIRINFPEVRYTKSGIAAPELFELFSIQLKDFENRLKKLIDYSARLGAEPVFITQPCLTFKWNEQGELIGVADTSYFGKLLYNGVDYYTLLTLLNHSIEKVAGNNYLVIDLTSERIWREVDFYDFIHNTPKGSEKIANEIFKRLNPKFR